MKNKQITSLVFYSVVHLKVQRPGKRNDVQDLYGMTKKEALVCAPVLFSEVAMKSQSTALFELSTLGLLTSVFILMN